MKTRTVERNDGRKLLFDNKALRNLILPLIIEQLLAILVGMADTVMVSSVGEAAMSAVSLIDTIMILLINAFAALATGGAIIAGQALGRKNQEDGCVASEQTVILSAVSSVFIMGILYLLRWFVLHVVFGRIEPEVMAAADLYYLIVVASIPFMAVYSAGAAIYRAMGDSRTPMLMSLLMNGINVAGNAILIYGLHFGVAGAAIPTTFSRAFTGIWILVLLRNPKKTLHIRRLRSLRPEFRILRKILGVGLPYSMENSMFQLGKILVLSLVSGFGTSAIAANAVCNSIAAFAIMGGAAMGYAISTVTAQCVGAGDFWQVRYYTRKLLRYSYVVIFLSNAIILLLLPAIDGLFHLTPETAEIVKQIMIWHAIMAVTFWPIAFTLPNTLRAANDAKYCMWVAISVMWACRIGLSYVIGKYMGVGVLGVWIAMTIDWVVRSVFFIPRYRGEKWYPIRGRSV